MNNAIRKSNFAVMADFRADYRNAGLCIDCGNQRGPDGTTTRCRPCANKANAFGKKRNKGQK